MDGTIDLATLTVEQAEQRIAEIDHQLTVIGPQLQAEGMFLRGWLAAKTAPSDE